MAVHAVHAVRAALPGDAAALDLLYQRVMAVADWLPATARAAGSFAEASRGEWVFVVGAAGGEVAGLIAVEPGKSFVHHLYVAAPCRRQGVGAALLASLHGWLPRPWRLKCVCANQAALGFYAALGWVDAGGGDGEQGTYRLLEFTDPSGTTTP